MNFGDHLATSSFDSDRLLSGEHVRKMIGGPIYIYVNSENCSLSNIIILFTYEIVGKECRKLDHTWLQNQHT
jgi:hypothetical protein